MNFDKFTIKMKEALQGAENLASRYNNSEIGNEHMLLSMLQQQDGIAQPLFAKVGVNYQNLLSDAHALVEKLPKAYGSAVNQTVSNKLLQVLNNAQSEADQFKDEYVSTERIHKCFSGNTISLKESTSLPIIIKHSQNNVLSADVLIFELVCLTLSVI